LSALIVTPSGHDGQSNSRAAGGTLRAAGGRCTQVTDAARSEARVGRAGHARMQAAAVVFPGHRSRLPDRFPGRAV